VGDVGSGKNFYFGHFARTLDSLPAHLLDKNVLSEIKSSEDRCPNDTAHISGCFLPHRISKIGFQYLVFHDTIHIPSPPPPPLKKHLSL
jgi:hypothetical protein